MRMWKVNPLLMCDQHLLGEHVELHMFAGTINKGISLEGYIHNGLVETNQIRKRHRELVKEMIRRGMNHKSELPSFKIARQGRINIKENIKELSRRCNKCNERIKSVGKNESKNILCCYYCNA